MESTKLYRNFLPLTAEAFKPFGDVLERKNHAFESINHGNTQRYPFLSFPYIGEGGYPQIHIYRATPYPMPFTLNIMDKHPMGSQSFLPMSRTPFLIIVAPPSETVQEDKVRAFVTNGYQGITYRNGVWHHPLMAYREVSDFFVVDRGGDDNQVEYKLEKPIKFYID